ncbi:MAG: CrcB family protein [Clostridium sp.]|nr:CrcB family protein [Clostridium sp.]
MVLATEIIAVALGGAVGSVLRYAVEYSGIVGTRFESTVAVNIVGSLLIGIITALLLHSGAPRLWQLLAVTGFLGGFTTYSAFSLQTVQLFEAGEVGRCILYVGVTLVGAVGACAAGLLLTRSLLRQFC